MPEVVETWILPVTLALVGAAGLMLLFRLLFLPLRGLGQAVRAAREPSTDARLLPPRDALALTAGATALGIVTGTGTAVALGGPGAITWVIVGGLVSAAIRYTESAVAWQTRSLFADSRRMSASVAPILRGLSRRAGKPLAIGYAVLAVLAIALSLGAAGSAELATDGHVLLHGAARFAPAVLAVVAIAVTFRSNRTAGVVVRWLVPVVVGLATLLFIVALFANASRVPGAFGRMLEQAFTGGAPSAGFLGSFFAETMRFGLTRGIFTGSSLGVAAAVHGASGAPGAHRAGLVASLEPLAVSVVLPLLVGLAVVSSRAWNTAEEQRVPLSETRAYLREPASAAELDGDELALDGIIRVREGQSYDRFYLAVHRGIINEPRFEIDGQPWDGAVRFADGLVTQLLEPTGRFRSLDEVDLAKVQRIVVTGEGPLVGAPLLGHTLASFLPQRWGPPLAALLLLALGVAFALALVVAADSLGAVIASDWGSLAARVLVALGIATGPFWVRGTVQDLVPLVAVAAALLWVTALVASAKRAARVEDEDR